jgi:hypothetical protein
MTLTWTTDKPTEPGGYWAYGKDVHGRGPYVWIVEVDKYNGRMDIVFRVFGDEYDPEIEWKDITHWMGPLEEPEPPEVP